MNLITINYVLYFLQGRVTIMRKRPEFWIVVAFLMTINLVNCENEAADEGERGKTFITIRLFKMR